MASNPKFRSYTMTEFQAFIQALSISRKITHIQIHHTWKPRKSDYKGEATIKGMWRYHTETRGWHDIGQHFSVSPDGLIWDGRSLQIDPAGISGHNKGGIMFEMIGNFDKGEEKLEGVQLDAIIAAVRVLIKKFNLKLTDIVFHREYAAKTCPGTGITKDWFLNEVSNREIKGISTGTNENDVRWKKQAIDWLYEEGLLSAESWRETSDASLPLWAEAIVLKRFMEKVNNQSN